MRHQVRNLSSRLSGQSSHTITVENRAGGQANKATKLTRTAANVKPASAAKSASSGSSGKSNASGNGGNAAKSNGNAVKGKERTPSRTAYAIHVAAASNGAVSVSAGAAVSGTTVTITPKPKSGFVTQSVTVEGVNIKGNVAVKNSNGRYTFTMPAKQVRVKAKFVSSTSKTAEKTETQVKTLPGADDVKVTDWFYEDVAWAYQRNILKGYDAHNFRPNALTSNFAVILTLGRLDKAGFTSNDAVEVSNWAKSNGVWPSGVPFDAYAPLTRGELAVILRNYLAYRGIKAQPSNATFSDADKMTEEQREAFQILNEAGIFRGDRTAAMLPKNHLNRAHLAALLHRLSEYIIKTESAG